MALTDIAIRSAKPRERTYRLFDGGGLYVEVTSTGGKWWRLKYRASGREKRLSLGVYPQIGLKEARERREQARNLLATGVDPSAARRAERATRSDSAQNTFEAVAREWWGAFSADWSDSYRTRALSRLERGVFPWIGSLPIGGVSPPQLLNLARRIQTRGALYSARRVLGLCSQVFRYGVATGRCERDPTRDLRGSLPAPRETHFAAITEPTRLGALLRAIESYEGTMVVRAALRLAPLVFVRPGELRKARWVDVDLQAAEWRFLATKTGTPHIVPLSKQAVGIVRELQPLTGRGEYLFPSPRTLSRPMSDNAVLAALRRMGISKEEMTGHGFRAAARTNLDEVLGYRPDYIEHQLAHAVRDPNGRAYNRTAHLAERTKMMQAWADYLDKIKSDGERSRAGAKRGSDRARLRIAKS